MNPTLKALQMNKTELPCWNCGELLPQLPKKKQRRFCNSTCRSNYWAKGNRKKLRVIKEQIKAGEKIKRKENLPFLLSITNQSPGPSVESKYQELDQETIIPLSPKQDDILKQIERVEYEMEHPPDRPAMGLLNFLKQKRKELDELRQQL